MKIPARWAEQIVLARQIGTTGRQRDRPPIKTPIHINARKDARPVTWDELIALVRQGDYGALCATLEDSKTLQLSQPHLAQLAAFIRDAVDRKRKLERPHYRPSKSPLTRAYKERWPLFVIRQLREMQLRGSERALVIEEITNKLPKKLRPTRAEIATAIKNKR